jgi:hypothetical protein
MKLVGQLILIITSAEFNIGLIEINLHHFPYLAFHCHSPERLFRWAVEIFQFAFLALAFLLDFLISSHKFMIDIGHVGFPIFIKIGLKYLDSPPKKSPNHRLLLYSTTKAIIK